MISDLPFWPDEVLHNFAFYRILMMLLRIIDNRLFRSIDNILLDWKDGVNLAFLIDSLAPGSWEDFEDLTPESGIICQKKLHQV